MKHISRVFKLRIAAAIYLAGAVAGGSFFLWRSIELIRNPGPKSARSNFFASFVQLGLLLIAAIADGSLNL